MPSPKDLLNKSGGGGFFPQKPTGTPIVPPPADETKPDHGQVSGKPKGNQPGAKLNTKGAAGGSTPTGVRPKV